MTDADRMKGKWTFPYTIDLGVQNEAGQRLIEFSQENILVIAMTLFHQHKRSLHTWTLPDGQYKNQIDSIFCS